MALKAWQGIRSEVPSDKTVEYWSWPTKTCKSCVLGCQIPFKCINKFTMLLCAESYQAYYSVITLQRGVRAKENFWRLPPNLLRSYPLKSWLQDAMNALPKSLKKIWIWSRWGSPEGLAKKSSKNKDDGVLPLSDSEPMFKEVFGTLSKNECSDEMWSSNPVLEALDKVRTRGAHDIYKKKRCPSNPWMKWGNVIASIALTNTKCSQGLIG